MKEMITFKNRLIFNEKSKFVTKFFHLRNDFEKELFIYKHNLDFAPQFLSYDENELSISIELIEDNPIINLQHPNFKKIANLFYKLHTLTDKTICLIDTNPKNFLYSFDRDRYFIIDFSDWEYRDKEFDLIHFLLFWASLWNFEKFSYNAKIFLYEYEKLNTIKKIAWKNRVTDVITFFDDRRKLYKKKEKKFNKDTKKNRIFLKKFFL